ncbi:metal ABC transporter permease [Porcipelethomonas sp.]|uniref:metal ABC transporter permease n=1 Tax=Porcipelethomonas sp. TaxID=2981675 RepID=UPI003EF71E91
MLENIKLIMTPEFIKYIILPALIGGIAVTLCSALLGVSLVLKRYSMIGDGLSHVGYGALCVAAVMNFAPLKFALPVVIIAAIILLRLGDSNKLKGDSAIAVFSTTALALGILVSSKAGLMNDVSHYMFGSILAMDTNDVILSVVLSAMVIIIFILFYHKIFAVTFDENFSKATGIKINFYKMLIAVLTAITIVLGMMMMGSLLISSLIIFPAITSMRVCKSFRSVVICSGFVSVFSFLIGLCVSLLFNTAPGASIVIVNVIVFLIFTIAGKIKGM